MKLENMLRLILLAAVVCFSSNVYSISDFTFVRSHALIKYRLIVPTSTSGETVTYKSTTSLTINRTPLGLQHIDVNVHSYEIVDASSQNPKFIACGTTKDYGVYCTNFTSLPLTDTQQKYLAYRTIEDYYIDEAKIAFFTNFNYSLSSIKSTTQAEPNVIFYTTWPGYKNYKGSTYPNSREIWISSLDEFKSRVASNVNDVCSNRNDSVHRFTALYGLPPDVTDLQPRYFVLGHVDVKQATVDPRGNFTQGIFRPCLSPSIDATVCIHALDYDSIPAGEEGYYNWVAGQYKWAYIDPTNPDGGHYPWHAQGFTYNWYPWRTSIYGLSEYVLTKNTGLYVNDTKEISEILDAYCTTNSTDNDSSSLGTAALVTAGAVAVGTGGYIMVHATGGTGTSLSQ